MVGGVEVDRLSWRECPRSCAQVHDLMAVVSFPLPSASSMRGYFSLSSASYFCSCGVLSSRSEVLHCFWVLLFCMAVQRDP